MDQPCTHGVTMTEISTKQLLTKSGRSGLVFHGLVVKVVIGAIVRAIVGAIVDGA
ncbi:hypothetical protein C2G38_2162485 [Gigaspora rosea]|uniref:Uncharacterized protein n=1 Tax=Gigaspora rosea TaxID=44941 RepID=A0A397W397_9GLOM|nr:hypothetical protein C2G38_2162485 [Gigaspora rosea]